MPAWLFTIVKSFILPMILNMIRRLLFTDQNKGHGWRVMFFNKVRAIIADTRTKVDDATLLPIVDQIEIATTALDDEEFVMGFFQEFLKEVSDKEDPKIWGDTLLDFFEQAIAASETTWDDKLMLPMIILARSYLK